MIVEISGCRAGAGGDGDERRDVGAGVGDERLLAVDHPLARRSSSTARVRVPPASLPGLGLGEAEAAERPPGAQVGQPPLALLLGAEVEDRVGAEADAGLEGDGQRLVDPGDLLDGHAQRGEVAAAAAVLLGEREAEQAELAHRPHHVDREVWSRSHSSACGAISASAKSRTTLRNASCSGDGSKSTATSLGTRRNQCSRRSPIARK